MKTTNFTRPASKFPYIKKWLNDIFPDQADHVLFMDCLHKIATLQEIEPIIICTNSTWDDSVLRFLFMAIIGEHVNKYVMNDNDIRGMLLIRPYGCTKVKPHFIEMAKVQAHDVFAGAQEFQFFKEYLQIIMGS